MARQIILHGDYFLDFYKILDINVKHKIQYVLELIKQGQSSGEIFITNDRIRWTL
jgi:hypothetical protein